MVLFRHKPLGNPTVPGFMSALSMTGQWISPSALKTRAVSPVARSRAAASRGWICSAARRGLSSPRVDVIVFSLAGERRTRGWSFAGASPR